MMDDLISRQAAIDALKNMYDAAEKWGCEAKDEVIKARAESCMASLIEMKLRIEKLPSAQPETATWIPESDRRNHWHCSSCGYVIGVMRIDAKFCPNCGAHMEVENEEKNDG